MPKTESRLSNEKYTRCAVANHFPTLLLISQPPLRTIGHHPELHRNQAHNVQRIHRPLHPPAQIILPLYRHLPRPRHLSQKFLHLRHHHCNRPFTPTQQQTKTRIFHHTNVTSQDHRKARNAKIGHITRKLPFRTIRSPPKSFHAQ
jgi:hypothetical protein